MYHFAITNIQNNLYYALDKVVREARLFNSIGKNVFLKPNFTYPFLNPESLHPEKSL